MDSQRENAQLCGILWVNINVRCLFKVKDEDEPFVRVVFDILTWRVDRVLLCRIGSGGLKVVGLIVQHGMYVVTNVNSMISKLYS